MAARCIDQKLAIDSAFHGGEGPLNKRVGFDPLKSQLNPRPEADINSDRYPYFLTRAISKPHILNIIIFNPPAILPR